MTDIVLVMGTRPEIIKMAPIIEALKKKDFTLVHTGQHYDYDLSLRFIKELELIEPDETFVLRSPDPALQISEMIKKLHDILTRLRNPKVVVSLADTNTAFAAGISAIKCKINLVHVEAGLRSHDWRMPEEHNRIALDHISNLLLTPTRYSKNNLTEEKVVGRTFITGNTVIDAVSKNLPIAKSKSTVNVPSYDFALATLHRAENVDDERTLRNLVNALMKSPVQVVFPVHPRTRNRLKAFGLYDKVRRADNIHIIPPIGYFDFLILMQKCRFLMSDSGGIQEEVTSPLIRKKVLLLRESTERQEAVKAGFVRMVGTREGKIADEIRQTVYNEKKLPRSSPYGDGHAGRRIAKFLLSYAAKL